MNETQLLKAAREGDERAFAALVEAHRGPLYAHCYQMLGSIHDADDAVQDALLKAWRALARFEARSSLRTWLYTIATNVCLRMIERRPSPRVLPMDYGPRPTPTRGSGRRCSSLAPWSRYRTASSPSPRSRGTRGTL